MHHHTKPELEVLIIKYELSEFLVSDLVLT
jgi:hypothetical protein